MGKKVNSQKLAYFAASSYNFRGWICVLFLLLIIIVQIFNFSQSIGLIFALIACFWGGSLFLSGAIKELFKGYIGFNGLLSFFVLAMLAFGILGQIGGQENCGWAFAGMSLTLLLADFLKAREIVSLQSSFKFMESLDNFISPSCVLKTANGPKKVFCEEVKIGDIIILKNSHRLAFDGEIVKGATLLDENLLTGNITLASKQEGDRVLAGSVNKGQDVEVKVLSSRKTSHMARVLEAVKQSENRKLFKISVLENSAFTFLFAAVMLAISLGAIFYISDIGNVRYFSVAFQICLFLMLLSPVSYMLSVALPWHYLSKVTLKDKIKINDITVLERLKKSNKIFIDKTGTLTTGHLQVAEIVPAQGITEKALMKAALTTQQNAQNIFAFALKEWGKENKMSPLKIASLELHPSYGALVRTEESTYLAGRRTWLENKGITVPMPEEEIRKTVFYVAKDQQFMGCIYFTDRLRANASATVKYLTKMKKTVCLISGDNTLSIGAAAKRAGIKEYFGNMYPPDKAAKISAEQNLGTVATMIGDGFNDILALLQADASLAFVPSNNLFTSWVDVIIKGKDFTLVRRIFELYKKGAHAVGLNLLLTILSALCAYALTLKAPYLLWWNCGLFFALNICVIFLNSVRLKNE